MKKALLLIFISIITNRCFSENEKTIRHSTIKDVKVYMNGAVITRTAQVNIDPGTTKLIVENLSPYINPASINIGGTGDVIIMGVLHQLNYMNASQPTPEAKQLMDSLENLKDDMQLLQNTKYILDQEEQLLLANKQAGGKEGITAAALNNLADVFTARLTKIKEKQTLQNKKIKLLQDKINKTTSQLSLLNQKNENGTSSIIINVSARSRTVATMELSYLVGNASWVPIYDLRAIDNNSPLRLTYKANVTQNTGEEWTGVKLILSTGNPASGGDKPILFPWILNLTYPVAFKGSLSGNATKHTMAAPYVLMTDSNSNEVGKTEGQGITYEWSTMNTETNQNQLATDFYVTLPCSIPSDGKANMVELQNYTLNASYNYTVVPKKDRDVFLTASIKDWEELNLVAGNASVYFQNTYVGSTYIRTDNTLDSILFSLGRDKRIIVTHEKKKDYSNKQAIGNNIIRTYAFEINIKNTKKEPVTIMVEDQIPISQNSNIEIKLLESDNAEYNKENGSLKWIVNVNPGETQKKKLSFSVKYPKDKIVSGL